MTTHNKPTPLAVALGAETVPQTGNGYLDDKRTEYRNIAARLADFRKRHGMTLKQHIDQTTKGRKP